MADPVTSVIADPPPAFPAVSRLAPQPPAAVVAAELEARSTPGDIVVDLHGRGGWIARAAIARLRKAYVFESNPLTRLLAEVVLRPPDIRHFDAAVKAIAFQPRGQVGLHQALNELYASRCATCQRPVVVDEFVWEADAKRPSRKIYRCTACRDQIGGSEMRNEPADDEDAALFAGIEVPQSTRDALLARFPVLDRRTDVAEQILALYTPRTLIAIDELIEKIERELRAAPLEAALRLALLHMAVPASRLNGYPGRTASLRIADGRIRTTLPKQWRECNAWHLFNEGCRQVRGFLQRLESIPGGAVHARVGDDLLALVDGSANVVLKRGSPALRTNAPVVPDLNPLPGSLAAAAPSLVPGGAHAANAAVRAASNVRLVLTQPPPRWTSENLSFAYLGTALALGRDATASLPLDAIFGPAPRTDWGWESVALRRSLAAVAPVLAPDAAVVVMLEHAGAEGLVAGALGGVGAGYRLRGALLAENGEEVGGTLEFLPPARPGRRRAQRGSGDEPPIPDQGPFQLSDLEGAVSDVAVSILQERGEPARFERLLGQILVGLDRGGHLRRLVGTHSFTEGAPPTPGAPEAVGLFGELPAPRRERGAATQDDTAPEDARPEAPPRGEARRSTGGQREEETAADGAGRAAESPATGDAERFESSDSKPGGKPGDGTPGPAADGNPDGASGTSTASIIARRGSDHVGLLLEMILKELHRADHPSLVELEPGRWWLKKGDEVAKARLPLSDRVEWAVFSLLSTAGSLSEAAFFDRIGGMFRGHDAPDEALVRACLESYRSPNSTPESLYTDDVLQARYDEHTDLIGQLTEYGHRLGLRCWIGHHEQKRTYKGRPLGSLLSDAEHRTYLPFVARGSVEALESTDCIWYLRGKVTFLFEVEWTAMLGEPLLRRGPQIPTDDHIVRFIVLLPERTELARFKLDRSPLLRQAVHLDNWHFLKSNHLRTLLAEEEPSLERFAPFVGLDPDVEILGEQLPLSF